MRLTSFVLGFFLRKVGVLAAMLLSLFLGYLLIQAVVPALRDAAADRDRLEQVVEEQAVLQEDLGQLNSDFEAGVGREIESVGARIDAEIEMGRGAVTEKKAEIKRLRDGEQKVCGFVRKAAAVVLPGNACKAAEKLTRAADGALTTLEGSLSRAERDAAILNNPSLTTQQKLDRLNNGGGQGPAQREINNKQSELGQKNAEEASLKAAQASGAGFLVNQWDRSWRWLAGIALVVLVLPVVVRVVSYFVLMPVVKRTHKPIHLAAGSVHSAAELRTSVVQRVLTIQLESGEVLSARSEHVRPVQGKVRSRLLYDWASPFISFAAGLYSLSRITGDDSVTSATLATPNDPDSYLMRIDFNDHPGLVMRPKHVVGVIGMPELKTRWRWGIAAFATWQVRYIMFAGSGSLIVQGTGDVVATTAQSRSTRMEQSLMMGFDSRLSVGVNRTEVFWPYLGGRTPLVDDEFTGPHEFFWQKSSTDGSGNPITKVFNAFLSAFGKLFGF